MKNRAMSSLVSTAYIRKFFLLALLKFVGYLINRLWKNGFFLQKALKKFPFLTSWIDLLFCTTQLKSRIWTRFAGGVSAVDPAWVPTFWPAPRRRWRSRSGSPSESCGSCGTTARKPQSNISQLAASHCWQSQGGKRFWGGLEKEEQEKCE